MASLPPRRNPTPTKISKQHLTPLQILFQMGFPKQRAEKAIAATGNKGVQLASDWLLAHVNDPFLDDDSPREYILYACPTGPFLQQLQSFWSKSLTLCEWNGAHNFTPHITLVSFFKAPDEDCPNLAQSLKTVMEKQGAVLNEPLKLETYASPNFMGFFVAEEHADYLKRIAMQYVKEVSNATISLEPHVKSLHLTLAYQFPSSQYTSLKSLVDELDPNESSGWELRLYSRDPRINGKQIHKVVHTYIPTEADELELRIGDYIYLSSEALSSSPDGWVEGTSWLTGLSGLLPINYTERTAESDSWTLHKKIPLNNLTSPSTDAQHSHTGHQANIRTASETNMSGHSVLNNDDITLPVLPDPQSIENKANLAGALKENIYQNLVEMKKSQGTELTQAVSKRSVFVMRHGERIDFTFGSWIPHVFDEHGNYIRKDLNMPSSLPERKNGQDAYLKDSPLTNIGLYEALLVGEALAEKKIYVEHVYCSPSYRCVQTCDSVLKGLNRRDIKIKIEPGLFEWMAWYPSENVPGWMTTEEFISAGFNVDENYQPFVTEKQLKESSENCEQFYYRNAFVTRSALSSNERGNVLLVGHTATLDTCTRELTGKAPRSPKDMTKIIQKIPYCSLIEATGSGNNWEIIEPPSLPLTHSTNQRFDWRILL